MNKGAGSAAYVAEPAITSRRGVPGGCRTHERSSGGLAFTVLLGLSLLHPRSVPFPQILFLLQEKIRRVGRIQGDRAVSFLTSAEPSH